MKHGKLCCTACASVSCCERAIRVQATVFTCGCARAKGFDAASGLPGLIRLALSGMVAHQTSPFIQGLGCQVLAHVGSAGIHVAEGEATSRSCRALTLCMRVGVADRALVDRVVVAVLLALGQHTLTSAWVVRHACIAIHTLAKTGRLNAVPRQ